MLDAMGEQTFLQYSRFAADVAPVKATHQGLGVEIWARGILYLAPQDCDPKASALILSSGIHGNETGPIEMLDQLIQAILAGTQELKVPLLAIFANIPAMNQGVRQIKHNLNRLFTPDDLACISAEHTRALELKQAVKRFIDTLHGRACLHLDMHSAIRQSKHRIFAIHPFVPRYMTQQQLLEMRSGDVEAMVFSKQATNTFSFYTASAFGIDALTVELGSVAFWGQTDLTSFAPWLDLLRQYLAAQSVTTDAYDLSALHVYEIVRSIHKKTEKMILHFPEDLPNFTAFQLGTLLAEDDGIEHRVTQESEVVLFPNIHVALGQRVMLVAKHVPLQDVFAPDASKP